MNLSDIFNKTVKTLKSNSPTIFTTVGVIGVGTTAYLTGVAAHRAARLIDDQDLQLMSDHREEWLNESKKDELVRKTKLVWRCYIPAATSVAVTTTCILGASKANGRRTAAAVTAYSLTEKAFLEYREKVSEEIGKGKERKIRDELAQANVTKNEPSQVIIANGGNVLCCELMTGRYFKSDMETLRKAQNDINSKINNELYVSLDEFYDIIGLPHTSQSDILGWDSAKLMDLVFSTVLSPAGDPCLSFEYNYTKPL